MQTKVEGIVLNKLLYKDRHLICRLLLRSGKNISVLFMGGKGGGKKCKPTTVELGRLLKIELVRSRSTSEMYTAREWIPLWVHQKIRFNYKAFSLMCFFLEMSEKVSVGDNLHELPEREAHGAFNVLANGLYYLEESLKEERFSLQEQGAVFLSKLLIDQGVFPDLRGCIFCDKKFMLGDTAFLISNQGGLSCQSCYSSDKTKDLLGSNRLWPFLKETAYTPYKDLTQKKNEEINFLPLLFHYCCYQLHLNPKKLKSVQGVL